MKPARINDKRTPNEHTGRTPARKLRVAQITDTHLFANPAGSLLGINTRESLQQVIETLRCSGRLDMVLATGDLVHDGSAQGYRRFCELMAQLDCPVYCIPGNHDERAAIAHHIDHPRVRTPRLVDAGAWRFVMLDSTIPDQEGGRLDADELAHLSQALRRNRRPTLVCLHHQPVPVGSAWIDTMAVENAQELFRILDPCPHVKGVIWGHVHQEFWTQRGTMELMAAPSTCVQFAANSSEFAVDLRPPGCRLLELSPDGRITSDILRLTDTPLGLQVASAGY